MGIEAKTHDYNVKEKLLPKLDLKGDNDSRASKGERIALAEAYNQDKEELLSLIQEKKGVLHDFVRKDLRKHSESLIGKSGIREIQEFFGITVDGDYGRETLTYILAFQKKEPGVILDGVAGGQVLRRIRKLKKKGINKYDFSGTDNTADVKIKKAGKEEGKKPIARLEEKEKLSPLETEGLTWMEQNYKKGGKHHEHLTAVLKVFGEKEVGGKLIKKIIVFQKEKRIDEDGKAGEGVLSRKGITKKVIKHEGLKGRLLSSEKSLLAKTPKAWKRKMEECLRKENIDIAKTPMIQLFDVKKKTGCVYVNGKFKQIPSIIHTGGSLPGKVWKITKMKLSDNPLGDTSNGGSKTVCGCSFMGPNMGGQWIHGCDPRRLGWGSTAGCVATDPELIMALGKSIIPYASLTRTERRSGKSGRGKWKTVPSIVRTYKLNSPIYSYIS